MKTLLKVLSWRWTALLAAVLLAFPVLGDQPAPKRSQARYEVKFMEQMIDHHNMAIMMSQLCDGRATNAELQALCDMMITDQQREIADMTTWLRDWYGVEYEPKMTRRDEKTVQRLAALTDADFEIAFMREMIKHHSIAIRRSTTCERRAFHEDLKTMCTNMKAAQTAEIAMMQGWLCQWYQVCPRNRR